MIKNSLQKSYRRWVDEGRQDDWWDGVDESMLEVNFYKEDAPLKVCVYQNVDVRHSRLGDWIETKTDRWVDVTKWVNHDHANLS